MSPLLCTGRAGGHHAYGVSFSEPLFGTLQGPE